MSTLAAPPRFALAARDGAHITLAAEDGARVHVFVLEEDIIRVLVLPGGALRHPRTWALAPGADDGPIEGRDRFDLAGFALPVFTVREDADTLEIETAQLRVHIRLAGFFCRWSMRVDNGWTQIAADRPTQAYNFGWWDERVYHYLARDPRDAHFGLGECAGPMNRDGRRYRLSTTDALGYDAARSDPLYKHIPFYLTVCEGAGAFGLFYDTLSDCTFDFGCERDNYHGLFRSFVADHGDLDYYMIAGPDVGDVTRRFTRLTGRPAFLPRWGLGYSGSTMTYTDAPDAQARMAEFLDGCERHDILCESFHLSSGYTSIGPRRYVFTWNRDKFPDPAAFAQSFLARGVRLCANVKPCLLRDHPLFDAAHAAGLLICDEDGSPSWVQFWDEIGAYLDFTNPDTLVWWRAHVSEALLAHGIAATWNDNNEFEIPSPQARAAGFGAAFPAREARPLHTMAMMRASRDAQRAHAPALRPFLVTRSGAAGMQRYAQTWSGDNSTSWETLRYNMRMGLGLALSGVSNAGHDVGGFSGAAPDEELFVRWIEAGIFLPRFSIHSWNDDGEVNEPWMHPGVTPLVRALIKFRAVLTPYLYHLSWRYADAYEPITRPTFLDFPRDPHCLAENDDLMLGPDLLVAPVMTPGARSRRIYLPAGTEWRDFYTGERFSGGQEVDRPAPLGQPVLFARDASAIPLNLAAQHFAQPADQRGFALFAPETGAVDALCFEDDGESEVWRTGAHGFWRLRVRCDAREIVLAPTREGRAPPTGTTLAVLLPGADARPVRADGARIDREASDSEANDGGRRRVTLVLE